MEFEQLQQNALEAINNLHAFVVKEAYKTRKFKLISKMALTTSRIQNELLNLIGLGVNTQKVKDDEEIEV